jgi:aspartate/tyrosine/aromatic aminotransferase
MPQRDDKGKPYVLPSVKKAEKLLYEAAGDKEYLPITVSFAQLIALRPLPSPGLMRSTSVN